MTAVTEAIAARFSTRGYTEEKLTAEELETLITAALQAPTAANRQEVHFTVLSGDNPVLAEIEAEKNRLAGLEAAPAHNFYYEAPTVFILSGDENNAWSGLDAGIATTNITLAAESLGLGTLIIGCIKGAMLGEKRPEFSAKLQLPEGYDFKIAIAVGHKATTKEPHTYDADKLVTRL